jgi:large subunit ribosomal protein L32
MAVPKRKTSKQRVRSRKAARSTRLRAVNDCPECGAARESHRACPSCGYYKGRQVVTVEAD